MRKLIDKNTFIKIFSEEEFRSKLDKIILDFFGLDSKSKINARKIKERDITLEIILMINTEVVLNIVIIDTQNLFEFSKKFYINLSYREVEKCQELIIPCYWEIYIPYSYKTQEEVPSIALIASLLYCDNIADAKEILNKLKIFDNTEVLSILKIINQKIPCFYKDK